MKTSYKEEILNSNRLSSRAFGMQVSVIFEPNEIIPRVGRLTARGLKQGWVTFG